VQPQGVQLRRGRRGGAATEKEIIDEVLELAELHLLLDPRPVPGLMRGPDADPELSAGDVEARHLEPEVSPSPRERARLHDLPGSGE
jgi:hypothetical protein